VGPDDPASNPFLNGHASHLRALHRRSPPTLATLGRTDGSLSARRVSRRGRDAAERNRPGRTPDRPRCRGGVRRPFRALDSRRTEAPGRGGERAEGVADAGRSVAFANAYPRGWPGPNGSRRIAGPPLAARGAGVLDRHEEALASGDAVASEIVNDGWRRHLGHVDLPQVTAREAGRNLAAIAGRHDLTLYAHYATDTAGHTKDMRARPGRSNASTRSWQACSTAGSRCTPARGQRPRQHRGRDDRPHPKPRAGLAAGPGSMSAGELRDLREVAPFIRRLLGAD
jgi:hypothetical protein